MPELPEVETVRRSLEKLIKEETIQDVIIYWDNIVQNDLDYFKRCLINQTFRKFERRGKYLIFKLDDYYLVSHLRMEGKYYVYDTEQIKDKHTHVVFKFKSNKQLHYNDTRKFGKMFITKNLNDTNLALLGPEPFSDDFNLDYVYHKLQKANKDLKTYLLDQSFVAGIGNIYANEICFKIGLNPLTPTKALDKKDINNLIKATREILSLAIEAGGSSIKSYTSSLGVSGRFQQALQVHQRINQPCFNCGQTIKKIMLNKRGTYFCENCQKLKN